MKTRVYIDGYNFYYGCLKCTNFKWLDLTFLFENFLLPRSGIPKSVLTKEYGIKFYTAEISDKVADDENSVKDQRSYHAGLKNHRQNSVKVQIVKGSYTIDEIDCRLVETDDNGSKKLPRNCEKKAKVWKIEEKQSDVNVALDAVFDAFIDKDVEQIVFATNDTDIAPALRKLKELNELKIRSEIKVGLVIPRRDSSDGHRSGNKSLINLADWTIHGIKEEELAKSQLPILIKGPSTSVYRPVSWFEFSEKVGEVLEILSSRKVCGSIPKAWRWLHEKKPDVDGLPLLTENPSEMLFTSDGVDAVLAHAKAYAEYKLMNA
ncbi:NYN domain-containing protein [Pseudoalteromonas sp. SG41-5]|uniref:NYN domain-containing protein n=1 Tax=Pseudoalteromonas sp. SG41-5 TaxID=2760975 RepID=UPI0015FED16A|nr:NYN domain-containing protein [Pseudoalteromonas sp. SG41-5]MBB1469281.1 NYN domain-containing protein [Pseudoalteromonas sp. SG41-5]